MENDLAVDKLIEKLVLCFAYDDIVKNIISKLVKMYDRDDLIVTDNSVEAVDKRFSRKIVVDASKGNINVIENGQRKEDDCDTYFSNEIYYLRKNGKGVTCHITSETKYIHNIVHSTKQIVTRQYLNNKNISYRAETNTDKYKIQSNGEIVKIKNSSSDNFTYCLSKKVSIIEDKKDGNVKFLKITKDDNGKSIEQKITEEDFNFLLYKHTKNNVKQKER